MWTPVVGTMRGRDTEEIELWMHRKDGKVSGVAILVSGPRELTLANLIGSVDVNSLADVGGHFELPKLTKK